MTAPETRTYGSLPRNFFRGPGGSNIDLAISKSTPIREKVRMEMRADFFNQFERSADQRSARARE